MNIAKLHRVRTHGMAVVFAVWLLAGASWAAAPDAVEATPESVGFSSERLAQLDRYMQELVASGHIPGATTLGRCA
jgi:hypothetical protein